MCIVRRSGLRINQDVVLIFLVTLETSQDVYQARIYFRIYMATLMQRSPSL